MTETTQASKTMWLAVNWAFSVEDGGYATYKMAAQSAHRLHERYPHLGHWDVVAVSDKYFATPKDTNYHANIADELDAINSHAQKFYDEISEYRESPPMKPHWRP